MVPRASILICCFTLAQALTLEKPDVALAKDMETQEDIHLSVAKLRAAVDNLNKLSVLSHSLMDITATVSLKQMMRYMQAMFKDPHFVDTLARIGDGFGTRIAKTGHSVQEAADKLNRQSKSLSQEEVMPLLKDFFERQDMRLTDTRVDVMATTSELLESIPQEVRDRIKAELDYADASMSEPFDDAASEYAKLSKLAGEMDPVEFCKEFNQAKEAMNRRRTFYEPAIEEMGRARDALPTIVMALAEQESFPKALSAAQKFIDAVKATYSSLDLSTQQTVNVIGNIADKKLKCKNVPADPEQ